MNGPKKKKTLKPIIITQIFQYSIIYERGLGKMGEEGEEGGDGGEASKAD